MKLIANSDGKKEQKPVVISIEQDEEDVNILANGEIMMFLSGSDGELHLMQDSGNDLEDMGFNMDHDDYIEISKD